MLLEARDGSAVRVEDRFTRVADDEALPEHGAILVSLSRFIDERDALLARDGELGVWLRSDETPAGLEKDLGRIALVALDFPVFSDGRAYSSARILRERFGYEGELRAVGDVLCEQLPFMLRSGFDRFEMASPRALEEFESVVREVGVVYQPTGDGRMTAIEARTGWRRANPANEDARG
ncbi:MAG TPA: DUF934 domain-containing protein [Deltaproteobacteria bacterium]|nr:DUF934 domain-containing protein [Deltaproteobacteria bacterium]